MTMPQNDSSKEQPPTTRAIPDEAAWALLLETYKKVKKDANDENDIALFEAIALSGRSGFKIPYEVRQIPGKGRGVVCTQFIPKGTCVGDDRSAYFTTEAQWREFLSLLPHDLARDCVDWAGVEDYGEEGGEAVVLDLNESSMFNHATSKPLSLREKFSPFSFRPKARANVKAKFYNGMWHVDATRDIHAGEELLCDYSQSHDYNHKLEWFETIYDEYYPDTPLHNELERWSK